MKNAAAHTRSLNQLLQRLARHAKAEPRDQRSPVDELIFAFMSYDATETRAAHAHQRLKHQFVDLNDLRVSDPAEVVSAIGTHYPKASERSVRLRAALTAIYKREHAVDLSGLADKPKKEVRAYLDSLDGMVPYVSAAVTLLAFSGHAIPLDDQLHQKLVDDGVVESDATFQEVSAFLEHHIRFEDAVEAHQRLRAYVEQNIRVDSRSAGRAKRPTRKTKRPTRRVGVRR